MTIQPLSTAINAMFSSLVSSSTQMSTLAQTVVSQGAELCSQGNYDAAEQCFKQAIALDPSGDNVTQAYNLLAQAYLQQNDTADAIKAYQSSIAMVPTDDNAPEQLGNIYFGLKDYSDAEKEYQTAVSIDPTSWTNQYALGQVYMATGRYQDAESQFKKAIAIDPTQYGGYYALGQTYSKEGQYAQAIQQFQKVVSMDPDFYDVYVDLGSAYANLGQMSEAQDDLNILNENDPSLASILSGDINQVTPPKFLAAYNTSGFLTDLGPGTPVSELNPSLSTPSASCEFNMVFVFNESMDPSSVQNPYNWTISQAQANTPGGAYDWGLPESSTDVSISPVPISVVYSADTDTATVSFLVQQNAAGDGTIDPGHIMFTFNGQDAYGNAMDQSANEYGGFSQII